MRYNGKNLVEILKNSQQYWDNSSEGSIANLSDANLSDANLSDANLSGANLSDANLSGANLIRANLIGANLIGTNLCDANFRCANLSDADLSGANLCDADLSGANLSGADLSGANLSGTDISGADFRCANLSGAIGLAPATQISIDRLIRIADDIVADQSKLAMQDVHSFCGTAHCGAGWACVNDPTASALEPIIGWCAAACFSIPIPEFTSLFYSSNQEMLDFLEKTLANNGQDLKDKYLITSEN